ncbi:hypothetical protein PV08_06088 [Exophiala spinifera]|uniref:Major facilitator superfamily (MFS) profile domain-containing protein n=1 Tax=Exophiala spinifera TaxID=91928 RepID=A0A0D1ZTF2_9EURO|nr:uncharacterized protein PV08_06088 [Exophiala spinifera]KIW16037.1 hypothetical protein PV08_06088 [Exophiala spinifera]
MPRRDLGDDNDERSPLIRAVNIQHSEVPQAPLAETSTSEEDSSPNERLLSGDRPPSETIGLEDSVVVSKSTWYLILLTASIGGLQIVWSVEFSNGSPYLLSLGMSKALLAGVWLAGPLTGALVQPYIGILSDRCRVSWGKRKPFMIAGTLGVIVASMILAYARDIVRLVGRLDADAPYTGGYMTATIILATVMMWCLDFSINTVQAAIRAFIVDGAPSHQQESANAWASRMTGVGNVLGYVSGYLNLPKYFHFFGNTQFKVLVVIASIALSSTVLLSILTIKERNPRLDPPSKARDESTGFAAFFRQVFVSIKRLPPQIRKVCEVQFFHWIGWFPFLFYITTYIGQLYVNPYLEPGLSDAEVEKLWAKATRVGTFALLIYAITAFSSNIVLPFLVVPAYKPKEPADEEDDIFTQPVLTPTSPIGTRSSEFPWFEAHHHRAHSEAVASEPPNGARHDEDHFFEPPQRSQSDLDVNRYVFRNTQLSDSTAKGPSRFRRWLTKLQIPGLTLRRTWLFSQLLFSVCMFSTFFISTPLAATVMTAFVGVSWSLTLWAPFALISAEISKRDEVRRKRYRQRLMDGEHDITDSKLEEEEDQAGIILGLHNVAISAPQIVATLISSAIFKLLQKPRNVPGDVSVGWTLRIGGAATLVAAFITWRMQEPADETEDNL